MEQQEKKPFYKKWWVVVIITIVIFIFILDLIGSTADKSSGTTAQIANRTENSSADETSSTKPGNLVPATQKQYQQIFTFKGNGAKKSEPFIVSGSRFKITYDCSGDLCQAFIFKVGSQLPQVVMNSVGAIKDETIMYGSGEYYLSANTMGSYTMTVYDYK